MKEKKSSGQLTLSGVDVESSNGGDKKRQYQYVEDIRPLDKLKGLCSGGVPEVADSLGVSPSTVRCWFKSGRLPTAAHFAAKHLCGVMDAKEDTEAIVVSGSPNDIACIRGLAEKFECKVSNINL